MGFVAAGFSAMGRGAGYVEIAEGDEVESSILAIVGEDVFKGELGFAVGIDGGFGMVLGDGDDVGLAVNGTGGGEDEVADAVAEHGVEKENAAGYVGDVEGLGAFMDCSTRASPAKCITASILWRRKISSRAAGSPKSAWWKEACGGTAAGWPSARLSRAMAERPEESRNSEQMLPM